MTRFFAVRVLEDQLVIFGETVAQPAPPWEDPLGSDRAKEYATRLLEKGDEVLSGEDLARDPRGRQALDAWDTEDDSALVDHEQSHHLRQLEEEIRFLSGQGPGCSPLRGLPCK